MAQSQAIKGDIFAVTIEGEYYAHRNGNKITSRYQVTLRMDETAKSMGFLSVARNKLLPRALKAKYPDYKRFRTHHITQVINETKNGAPVMEIALMNRKQLVSYVQKKGFKIQTDLYPEVSDLRQAIRAYRDSRDTFMKIQDKRAAAKGPELLMMRALDELNPDIDQISFTPEQEAQVYGQLPYTPTPATPVPAKPATAYSNIGTIDDLLAGGGNFDPDDMAEYADEGEDVTDVDYIGSEYDEEDELNAMLDGV